MVLIIEDHALRNFSSFYLLIVEASYVQFVQYMRRQILRRRGGRQDNQTGRIKVRVRLQFSEVINYIIMHRCYGTLEDLLFFRG